MMEEIQPLSGSTMAFETRYEVSTHVLSSVPAERLPAMWGRETLAMLVSSTSMKVASVTAIAMIQGLTAGRGRAAPSAVSAAVLISPKPWVRPTCPAAEYALWFLPDQT